MVVRALAAKTKRVRKTVKLRKNGKHKVDAASTIRAPIGLGLQRILRGQAQFRWLGPQLAAITPQYIEATLTGAMAGAHVQQWWLFDLMLKTWPELLACYTELIYGVLRKKMIFEPHHDEDEKPTPGADEKQKVVCAALAAMSPDPTRDESAMEGTIKDILDAWFRGLGVQEIVWQMVDDPVVGTIAAPKSTFSIDVSNYAFSNEGVLGLRSDKGRSAATWPYQTTSMQPLPSDLVAFPPNKFLIAKAKCSAGNTVAGALLRPLAWWWCAANFSSDWLLNLAQVFGLPFRWANYDTNAPQATIDAICNMLQNMGSAGWAAFPVGTTLEMISPSASQGSDHSPQGELLDRADRYCRNLLLGQTMTGTHGTTGKGGGQAFGEVEADVKSDRIDAAGKFAEQIINDQLIKFILALNYGDTDEAPTVRFLEDEEGDYNEAQRDKLLVDAGLPIGVDFMRKKYGIPEPAEGEETLEKAEPPLGLGVPPNDKEKPNDISAKLESLNRIKDDAVFSKVLSELAKELT
jgi:phage gp29-like protein